MFSHTEHTSVNNIPPMHVHCDEDGGPSRALIMV